MIKSLHPSFTSSGTKPEPFSLVRRLSRIGTLIYVFVYGTAVGNDTAGNRYYRSRRMPKGSREKRWVIFVGAPNAATVPPAWYGWLHHTTDSLPEQPCGIEPKSPYKGWENIKLETSKNVGYHTRHYNIWKSR